MRLRFRIRPPVSARTLSVERAVEVDAGRGVLTLGRAAGSEIELPFATVSARHARLVREGDQWSVSDVGSANGTFVGGERLRPEESRVLLEGQSFRLADVELFFEGRPAGQAGSVPESTATLARRLVNDLFGSCRPAELARLQVLGGPEARKELALVELGKSYRVGRARDCDLVLDDDDVSREHAAFQRTWSGVEVRDLGSKNGVTIDGRRIEGTARIRDGEIVAVGGTRLRLDDPEDRYLREMQQEKKSGGGTAVSAPELAIRTVDQSDDEEGRSRRRAPSPVGPMAVAAVAVTVLVGVGGLILWLLVGS